MAAILLLLLAANYAHAQQHEFLAAEHARLLSAGDRKVAASAEFEALDRDEPVRDFEWKGPDGGSGLIIVTARFPSVYGLGACRRLIHIIRHPADGGVNPTFDGVVCRNWEGKWSLQKP